MPAFQGRIVQQKYDDTYKEKIYTIWVSANQPTVSKLEKIIPPNDDGDTPSAPVLQRWIAEDAWVERAHDIRVRAQQVIDDELVRVRVEMLRRHADLGKELAVQGFEHLRVNGFDSSSSAVQAIKLGIQTERDSLGVELGLTKVVQMSDQDLSSNMKQLMERAAGLLVDGVVVSTGDDGDDLEVEDAAEETDTTAD